MQISGQIVNTSGQVANISGQSVTVSGSVVQISGQAVIVSTASGQFVSVSGTVATSISGNVVQIAGQAVTISGNVVIISGQSVTVSGNVVQISGQDIFLNSGSVTSIMNISGDILDVTNSGSIVQISGQRVVTASGSITNVSGDVVQISGQIVNTSGQVANISGQSVTVSGNIVTVSSGSTTAAATFVGNNPSWVGVYSFALVDQSGVADTDNHYISLFSPVGNSRVLQLLSIMVGDYSVVASLNKDSVYLRRITAASAGNVISSSAINKYDSTYPVESADVRTSDPTVTEGALVTAFPPNKNIDVSGSTSASRKTYTPSAPFILRAGEGVVMGIQTSGDTDQTYDFEIVWAER